VQLDRQTGTILKSFGDSVTQALAIDDRIAQNRLTSDVQYSGNSVWGWVS
jgi:hypothetical protein